MELFDIKKHLVKLFKKYASGTGNTEENTFIENYYDLFGKQGQEDILSQEERDNIESKIESFLDLNIVDNKKHRFRKYSFSLYVAASILLAIISGAILFYNFSEKHQTNINLVQQQPIQPGKNTAYVTINDGSAIVLEEKSDGLMFKDKQLTYQEGAAIADLRSEIPNEVQMITVSTPRGGQYNVTLPDGTNVWLNASSILKFPSTFDNSDQRIVHLEGEGYFEVAKNPNKRFIVENPKQSIEVLGTKFNISNYPDNYIIKTSVREGTVKVNTPNGSLLLQKEQASSLIGKDLKLEKADLERALAWKNGFFSFDDDKIEDIMRELSRWYDVDVLYDGTTPKTRFVGRISKYANVKDVLALFENTKRVKFKIEGRRIIVSQ